MIITRKYSSYSKMCFTLSFGRGGGGVGPVDIDPPFCKLFNFLYLFHCHIIIKESRSTKISTELPRVTQMYALKIVAF